MEFCINACSTKEVTNFLTYVQLHERLQKEGVKTHKQRVEELNKYLSGLSEHHDMFVLLPVNGLSTTNDSFVTGQKSDLDKIRFGLATLLYNPCRGLFCLRDKCSTTVPIKAVHADMMLSCFNL